MEPCSSYPAAPMSIWVMALSVLTKQNSKGKREEKEREGTKRACVAFGIFGSVLGSCASFCYYGAISEGGWKGLSFFGEWARGPHVITRWMSLSGRSGQKRTCVGTLEQEGCNRRTSTVYSTKCGEEEGRMQGKEGGAADHMAPSLL